MLLHGGDGHDAAMRVLQMLARFFRRHGPRFQHQDAGDDLQAVDDAVLHFLQQHLLLLRSSSVRLCRRAFSCSMARRSVTSSKPSRISAWPSSVPSTLRACSRKMRRPMRGKFLRDEESFHDRLVDQRPLQKHVQAPGCPRRHCPAQTAAGRACPAGRSGRTCERNCWRPGFSADCRGQAEARGPSPRRFARVSGHLRSCRKGSFAAPPGYRSRR